MSVNISECPVEYAPLQPATLEANLALFVCSLLALFLMMLHFLYYRNSSVLLRKRSLLLTLISITGAVFAILGVCLSWITSLPCALRALFDICKCCICIQCDVRDQLTFG